MSWASGRNTTRVEDTAYCLMGIFNVNMPLIYGEGGKAFLRLQQQILAESNDQSLLAWGSEYQDQYIEMSGGNFGVLAPSPRAFDRIDAEEVKLLSTTSREASAGCSVTHQGLSISLPLLRLSNCSAIAILNCQTRNQWIGIIVKSLQPGTGRYYRAHSNKAFEPLILIDPNATFGLSQTVCLAIDDPCPSSALAYNKTAIVLEVSGEAESSASYNILRCTTFINRVFINSDTFLQRHVDYAQPARGLCFDVSDKDWSMLLLANAEGHGCSFLLGRCNGRIWSHVVDGRPPMPPWEYAAPIWRHIQAALAGGQAYEDLADAQSAGTYINDRARYILNDGKSCLCARIKKSTSVPKYCCASYEIEIVQSSGNMINGAGRPVKAVCRASMGDSAPDPECFTTES